MIVSIIHDPNIKYPGGGDYFSPDHAWPEYRLGHLSGKPNPVYAAVRTCLAQAGLDKNNFGQPGRIHFTRQPRLPALQLCKGEGGFRQRRRI
jgi:hypothetical protein